MAYCKICGEDSCERHKFNIGRTQTSLEFSGSSPPEIFVGRWNYPNVYAGILAPTEYGNNEVMSSPEKWHEQKLSTQQIVNLRNQLVYGRTQQHIKAHTIAKTPSTFTRTMHEIAMTHKSVATEFKLKKPIHLNNEQDPTTPLIPRAAQVDTVRLEENAPVKPKVDYVVSDGELKSSNAIQDLYASRIPTSTISKILSAGLLGLKKNRKLVPTRWSITAVDDTLSKQKLKLIKQFPEISEIQLFTAEYVGNHYEFLLIPSTFAFEVIELSMAHSSIGQDYEINFDRKKYAASVTGAYYANRLALAEYLEKIHRQAACLVMREVRPEYDIPCGVGILREVSRQAFLNPSSKHSTLQEAFESAQSRLQSNILKFTSISQLLKHQSAQKKLTQFF